MTTPKLWQGKKSSQGKLPWRSRNTLNLHQHTRLQISAWLRVCSLYTAPLPPCSPATAEQRTSGGIKSQKCQTAGQHRTDLLHHRSSSNSPCLFPSQPTISQPRLWTTALYHPPEQASGDAVPSPVHSALSKHACNPATGPAPLCCHKSSREWRVNGPSHLTSDPNSFCQERPIKTTAG